MQESNDSEHNPTDPARKVGPAILLMSDGDWDYDYDKAGKLITRSMLCDEETWTYSYGDDALSAKAASAELEGEGGPRTVVFQFDGFGKLIGELYETGPGDTSLGNHRVDQVTELYDVTHLP